MDFNQEVESYKENIISDVQKLIAIKSVKEKAGKEGAPFGDGISRALDFCLDLAASMGFKTRNIDGYCGYAEYGEGPSYICAVTHLDTIEEGRGWKHDPFSGEIDSGKIYGRGAIDNKGPAVTLLYALKALADSGVRPGRKIRVIFGTDEEGGLSTDSLYRDIMHYLKNEAPPLMGFTIEANFPAVYAEKGLLFTQFTKKIMQPDDKKVLYIKGGVQPNTVPAYCKAKLITSDRSAIIEKIRKYALDNMLDFNVDMEEDGVIVEAFGSEVHSGWLESGKNAALMIIRLLAETRFGGDDMADTMQFLINKLGSGIYGEGLGIEYEDEFSGKLTHNLGVIDFDNRFIRVDLDFRYPVTCDFEESLEVIKEAFGKAGFDLKICCSLKPIYYPPRDHFAIKPLVEAYRAITGDVTEPIAIGGSTYAKSMTNIVAFGPVFPGEKQVAHTVDEYVKIDDLMLMGKIYAKALYDLSNV
jgi:dipeptidase, putative